MRIALVTRGDLFPTHHGAAVRIVRIAEHLSLQGAAVFVVTEDRDAYWAFEGGLPQRRAYSARARAAQEWPLLRQGERLAQRFCAQVGYPQDEWFLYQAQADPAWWLRVLWVGRAERIDVFQAEFPGYGLACALAARALGARSAVVQHNVEWDRLAEVAGLDAGALRRVRALERLALTAVDEVIAVSGADRERMVLAGVDAARITVIPHGVDLAAYAQDRSRNIRWMYSLPPDAPLLFFHGTLHYWPNTLAVRFIAEDLLPRLLPRWPDLRVMITGLNPPRYYAHESITFTGPVEDLPAHIQAADLAICPVPSGGGTRMKILEYFAAGRACVASPKGAEGIPARDGEELLLAEGAEAFAAAADGLLRDPARRARIGAQAREYARWLDWSAIARRTLALYGGQGRGGDYGAELAAARAAGAQAPAPVAPPPAPGRDPLEAHLPPRTPSKPLTLLLLINRGCNLRCVFCDLWDRGQNMPLGQVVGLLDEAQAIGTRTLVLTGGEPLLHPDLPAVVRAARERGLAVNITTNGTLVERRLDELIAAGVSSLSISLDGLEATHDALRGQRGAWARSVAALRRVCSTPGVAASVYFVVTRRNVAELVPVYELARGLGAGFDFWPVNDAPDLYLTDADSQRAYRDAVAHIARHDPEVAARRHFYDEGLRYHEGAAGRVRCLGLVDQYGVTFEGDLLPCCVWGGEGLRVGNVLQRPLRELWRSPEVQAHRARLYGEGCGAGCFNHSLYEFTRSTGESFRLGAPAAPAPG